MVVVAAAALVGVVVLNVAQQLHLNVRTRIIRFIGTFYCCIFYSIPFYIIYIESCIYACNFKIRRSRIINNCLKRFLAYTHCNAAIKNFFDAFLHVCSPIVSASCAGWFATTSTPKIKLDPLVTSHHDHDGSTHEKYLSTKAIGLKKRSASSNIGHHDKVSLRNVCFVIIVN